DVVGAPAATLGILIAGIVLLPEGVAAVRAAIHNRLQTSLNLAIGSAIASIGLTVPTVAVLSLVMGWPLALGLDDKSTLLLVVTLFVASLSLRPGRTHILLGLVHIVMFAAYPFLSFVPAVGHAFDLRLLRFQQRRPPGLRRARRGAWHAPRGRWRGRRLRRRQRRADGRRGRRGACRRRRGHRRDPRAAHGLGSGPHRADPAR